MRVLESPNIRVRWAPPLPLSPNGARVRHPKQTRPRREVGVFRPLGVRARTDKSLVGATPPPHRPSAWYREPGFRAHQLPPCPRAGPPADGSAAHNRSASFATYLRAPHNRVVLQHVASWPAEDGLPDAESRVARAQFPRPRRQRADEMCAARRLRLRKISWSRATYRARQKAKSLAPSAGLEPATYRLTAGRSAN